MARRLLATLPAGSSIDFEARPRLRSCFSHDPSPRPCPSPEFRVPTQLTLTCPRLSTPTPTPTHTAAIPYPELLAYAQSLSAFTSAPPNMPDLAPGQPPPPLFFPPFPNEEKMRRGHMSDEAPLGILGETHSVGKRESSSSSLSLVLVLPPCRQYLMAHVPDPGPSVRHGRGGISVRRASLTSFFFSCFRHCSTDRIAHRRASEPSWCEPVPARFPAAPAVLRPRLGPQPRPVIVRLRRGSSLYLSSTHPMTRLLQGGAIGMIRNTA